VTTRAAPTSAGPAAPTPAERERLAARVRLLSWVSLAYMTVEGGVAIADAGRTAARRAAPSSVSR
jgi:hypothetical protein